VSNDTKDFESIVKNIKSINPPLYATCGQDLNCIEFIGKDTIIYQYLPNACDERFKLRVIGKISEKDKYIALLLADTYGDYQGHFVATFTHKGELISSKELFIRTGCGEDENYFGTFNYTITKDVLINMKDSTAEFKRDSLGNIIDETIVAKSHNTSFIIADDGTIVKK
jgi:hypothetical protein